MRQQRLSFRKNSGISKIPSFTIRRKSCECVDCGQVCKKLQYVESISQPFQPYYQLKQKVQDQQNKTLQQKQLRMRDKRHHLLKKAMQVIKIKEIMSKKKQKPPKSNHHSMKLNTLPDQQAIIESNATPLPPRPPQLMNKSPNPKRICEKRFTTLHPLKRKQSNFGHFLTLPLDSYVEILIMKLITREYRAKFVHGSKDDFEFIMRLNKFQCENDVQEQVPSIRNMQYLDPMPNHDHEDYESSMNDNEQIQISLVPKLKSPYTQKPHYRDILKYNKRSLRNLVDQWQLCQSKTMKNLNYPLTHRLLSNNVSPIRKDFVSPNQSEINKKSLVKLPPIITTQRKYTEGQINPGNNYIYKGKHRKTQSQLTIKV